MKNIKLIALIIYLVLPAAVIAQKKLAAIDSLLTKLHNDEGFNGNVLIADKGHIIYEKSFGYSNPETKIPLDKNAVFNLASVSKTFTAVAALKLVDYGQLSLDAEVQRYLPDFPYQKVTIYHLLTHTSGLEDYMGPPVRNSLGSHPDITMIEKVYDSIHPKQRFLPGTNWSYSNMNFLFLALVIEKVSGMSYPEFLRLHIFRPAKMEHSFVLVKNASAMQKEFLAGIYFYPDFLAVQPRSADSIPMAKRLYALIENSYGDGGVFSTTGDLFRFQRALFTGKILNAKSRQLMYSAVVLPGGKTYESGNANADYSSGYGLGWIVAKDTSHGKIAWHSGSDPGILTFFMQNVTADQCVIVLNNNWYRGTFHLGGSLMNLLNNRPPQLMPASLARKIGQVYTLLGADSALQLLHLLRRRPEYHIGLAEMNELGYNLLARNDTKTAIEVFTVNVETYPTVGGLWDSLAEAYYKAGDKETAIKDYEKSIELDPNNEAGKNMLKKIKQETRKIP